MPLWLNLPFTCLLVERAMSMMLIKSCRPLALRVRALSSVQIDTRLLTCSTARSSPWTFLLVCPRVSNNCRRSGAFCAELFKHIIDGEGFKMLKGIRTAHNDAVGWSQLIKLLLDDNGTEDCWRDWTSASNCDTLSCNRAFSSANVVHATCWLIGDRVELISAAVGDRNQRLIPRMYVDRSFCASYRQEMARTFLTSYWLISGCFCWRMCCTSEYFIHAMYGPSLGPVPTCCFSLF